MTDRQRLLARIKGDPELVERLLMVADLPEDNQAVLRPEDAVVHFAPLLAGYSEERLAVLALNRRHVVKDKVVLTKGTDCFTIVDPRQILRWALTSGRHAPSGIILAHNHPSGDPTPSQQDIKVTRQVEDACKVVGISLLDHLVVCGPTVWKSMAELGYVYPGIGRKNVVWTG